MGKDITRLISDVEVYLISLPQSTERDQSLDTIKRIKASLHQNLTREDIAALIIKSPELVRSGLELALASNEEAFLSGVPQVFDGQTGLPSKIYFENALLPKTIARAEVEESPLSYLLMDFDNFHDFNEQYGRRKGDEAIKSFADLMKQMFRTTIRRSNERPPAYEKRKEMDRRKQYVDSLDYIGRMPQSYTPQGRVGGGEEFAVILYGCDETIALNTANRFLEEVRRIRIPYDLGQSLSITVSGGIAQYQKGMSPVELMENAEKALKYSKENGRDKVSLFSQLSIPPNPLS